MAIKQREGYYPSASFHASKDADTAFTNESVKTAPGAGKRIYITDIDYSMGATSRAIKILDGSGGTILWERTPAVTGCDHVVFKTPLRLTANTALCLTTGGDSTGFFIDVGGFVESN